MFQLLRTHTAQQADDARLHDADDRDAAVRTRHRLHARRTQRTRYMQTRRSRQMKIASAAAHAGVIEGRHAANPANVQVEENYILRRARHTAL